MGRVGARAGAGRRVVSGEAFRQLRVTMNERWIVRCTVAFFAVNLLAVIAAIVSGHAQGNLAYRFEEKQAITFISSNQLAVTAVVAWIVYLLRDRLGGAREEGSGDHRFWLLSAAGFVYLMLDESFQFHEGMDTAVVRLFGGQTDPLLDGAATLAYGIIAAAACYRFRREIVRNRATVRLFLLGSVFLFLTSVLNAGEASAGQIVLEEVAKLMGVVSFLLGHLAALGGVVGEVRGRLAVGGVGVAGAAGAGEMGMAVAPRRGGVLPVQPAVARKFAGRRRGV